MAQQAALAGRRVTARMRGLLWHLYSRDAELATAMMRVEGRIDSGHLRIRDEVVFTSSHRVFTPRLHRVVLMRQRVAMGQ